MGHHRACAPGAAAAAGLLLLACGPSPAASTPSRSSLPTAAQPTAPAATPSPAAPSDAPLVSPTGLAGVTPAPVPTLAGVHYIVPPGWMVASTSAVDARLTTGSGLTIVLRIADGSPGILNSTTGRPFTVDHAGGYEADGATPQGYRDQIDAAHGGHAFEVVCTSPTAGDRETTVNICEGFADGILWGS